ncbi:MAG: NAD(P)/FAD-dependent oxidoreductase [Desulfobacterales bacterium]|nr:NAD(P)/FAD-dependent oxidoreductase [Desulfobacterales bacterium]
MKIAVIGAGPGGLYAALAAARENIQVDLFEKEKSGRGLSAANAFLIRWGL